MEDYKYESGFEEHKLEIHVSYYINFFLYKFLAWGLNFTLLYVIMHIRLLSCVLLDITFVLKVLFNDRM